MRRKVQPERLDSLPPTDPGAQQSRRDLLLINQIMGNFRWFERQMKSYGNARFHTLELGAGGGELARHLHAKVHFATYSAVDYAPRPPGWPRDAFWHVGDILQYNHLDTTELLLANLILHHFTDEQLDTLGQRIRQSSIRRIFANETHRRPLHRWQLKAGCLIGFNAVTLHDGNVSIEAGFRGEELPTKLGLTEGEWRWDIETTLFGAYRMHATRRKAPNA